MDIEFLLRAKVVYDSPVKGRTYHRKQLVIFLPEDFKDWQLVPVWPRGGEVSLAGTVLRANMRKPKQRGE